MIYLASPYSADTAAGRKEKYLAVRFITAWLIKTLQLPIYSPIVHNHFMAVDEGLPLDHKFWLPYDAKMLRAADEVWIAKIDGWEDSLGVMVEQMCALTVRMPLRYVEWEPSEGRVIITPELDTTKFD